MPCFRPKRDKGTSGGQAKRKRGVGKMNFCLPALSNLKICTLFFFAPPAPFRARDGFASVRCPLSTHAGTGQGKFFKNSLEASLQFL